MKRIFITDDDDDDLEILGGALREIFNEVDIISCGNGNILFDRLKEKVSPPPDFLFLDLNMAGRSGHECLKELKAHPVYKDLRVVIFTTSNSPYDINSSFHDGADAYICKPLSLHGYKKALLSLLALPTGAGRTKEQFVIRSH